jgi:hypothetical protein
MGKSIKYFAVVLEKEVKITCALCYSDYCFVVPIVLLSMKHSVVPGFLVKHEGIPQNYAAILQRTSPSSIFRNS